MPSLNWTFAFASVIGNSHISEEIPCQDNCKVEEFNGFTIAVVSDGAGSYKHSQTGSKFVAEFSIIYFRELVIKKKWHKNVEFPDNTEWHTHAKKILYKIRKDLENLSIEKEVEFKSLSCTIIVTIILKNGILVTHIGDGRAGYNNFNNEWLPTITPFHGELANQTVFITSDIWAEEIIDSYIESRAIKDNIKAICLLSDGCEKASFECNLFDKESNSYYDPNRPFPPFFDPNVQILEELKKQDKSQEEINILWESFLTNGNEKLKIESDDKTLILGVNLNSFH
jgi:hypothetical protein